MTIFLPEGLPVAQTLRNEGFVVRSTSEEGASEALQVMLVNLMPLKEATELALARLLAQTGRPVAVTLVIPGRYQSHNTAAAHLETYYRQWPDVRDRPCDALIVTGAPVENLPFEDVSYWPELEEMIQWAKHRVGQSLYICWAAQAALYCLRGLPKNPLRDKAFGVFEQEVLASSPLTQGMGPRFPVPVSRHAETTREALDQSGATVVAGSPETGACIVEDRDNGAVCIFDHLEYDNDTLTLEYERDKAKGLPIVPPRQARDNQRWQPYAALFYRNWLERVAQNRRGDDSASMDWLFDGLSSPGEKEAQIVLHTAARPHLLSEVVARLATVGINPSFARILADPCRLARVGVRFEAIVPAPMEAAARVLLGIPGAKDVLIRFPNGSGGFFRPKPHAVALVHAA